MHNISHKTLHFWCLKAFWICPLILLQNTCRIITNEHWKALKGCTGMKWVLCLVWIFISSFLSRMVIFSFWFFKHENIFFHLGNHSVFQLSKINVECVLLARTLNRISVLLEMFSIYLTTIIIQWLFLTRILFQFFLGITGLWEREQEEGYYNTIQ